MEKGRRLGEAAGMNGGLSLLMLMALAHSATAIETNLGSLSDRLVRHTWSNALNHSEYKNESRLICR
ncbi:hypothetical protein SAMN04515647_4072 [Cohaesibacter sp. ES.047]|nr:hypothetical protein SAMN04515647_4072 [Cohaesibacter sp. ES.047]